jgi:hypothetical protein
VSFLRAKNSRAVMVSTLELCAGFYRVGSTVQDASSNGWISFFFVNLSTNGRLRVARSDMASLRIFDVFPPARKRVTFGFSCCCGARFSMARFARAFLGFLEDGLEKCSLYDIIEGATYATFNMVMCCAVLEWNAAGPM